MTSCFHFVSFQSRAAQTKKSHCSKSASSNVGSSSRSRASYLNISTVTSFSEMANLLSVPVRQAVQRYSSLNGHCRAPAWNTRLVPSLNNAYQIPRYLYVQPAARVGTRRSHRIRPTPSEVSNDADSHKCRHRGSIRVNGLPPSPC